MKSLLKSLCAVVGLLLTAQAMAQVTFYEAEGFRGRTFATNRALDDFRRAGFNDRASSLIIDRGRWEVCAGAGFQGPCMVLRPGSYDSLARMGLNDRISSVRPVRGHRDAMAGAPEPLPAPNYEYRNRPDERTFAAPVTSVHAVLGPPEQRCWVERQQVVAADPAGPNVGGALAGAVIGGILGHQIGSGRGQDAATIGGVVAGGAIGANAGRTSETYGRDVQRCQTVAGGPPAYWDVTYAFNGVEHRVQMTSPPGASVAVNRDGEPRG